MADEPKKADLSPHALCALACGFVVALGTMAMWQDAFATRSGAWDISLTPVLLHLAMLVAVPVGLYCCIVLWARWTKKSDAP